MSLNKAITRVVFRMLDCRVQSARKRKGLADHPCKSVGLVEYSEFAKAIDPRIRTRCIACPPDEHPEEFWCAWEFTFDLFIREIVEAMPLQDSRLTEEIHARSRPRTIQNTAQGPFCHRHQSF